jgi:hypothetical protein
MTVVVCSRCGQRTTLRSSFELDGECPDCGAEEALIPEDAYDPEPLELICCDCRAQLDGGPIGAGPASDEHEGRYTVEDPCPFCSTPDEPGELVPLESFKTPRTQPDTPTARAAAHKLWVKHGSQIPVDVIAIARAAGLTVIVGSFQHAGRLHEGSTIEVPETDAVVRQRFTVAHELGHAELRHAVPDDKLEVEANAFAAELLLPRQALREAVNEQLTFQQIAARFNASRPATLYALAAAKLLNKLRSS